MTPKSVGKLVVLTSASLGVSYAVNVTLTKAVTKVAPNLTEWDEEWTRKEKAIQATKIAGVTLGIALVAGVAATAVSELIDDNLWTEEIKVTNIEN